MAVNRMSISATQRPDLSWQLTITGWRVDNTVAWTKSNSLSVSESAGLGDVLRTVGVTLQQLLP